MRLAWRRKHDEGLEGREGERAPMVGHRRGGFCLFSPCLSSTFFWPIKSAIEWSPGFSEVDLFDRTAQVVEFFKPTMVAGGEDGVHFTLNRFSPFTLFKIVTLKEGLIFYVL